jgi:hypothetical protein
MSVSWEVLCCIEMLPRCPKIEPKSENDGLRTYLSETDLFVMRRSRIRPVFLKNGRV